MKSNSEIGSLRARILAQRSESEAWVKANPELAKAWDEARQEDYERTQKLELERTRARAEASLPDRLRGLGVPSLSVEALAKGEDTPALRQARRWKEQSELPWLLMLGDPGTGKTVAAAWVLAQHLRAHPPEWIPGGGPKTTPKAMFVRASTLARLSAYDAKDREWFEDCCKTRLLVLDDLSAEYLSDVAKALFDELLDTRYGNARRMVLTSNLSAELFKERYGDRLWDRLKQVATVYGTGKQSLRKKPAKAEVRQ